MDEKLERIRAFARFKGAWIHFGVYFYSSPTALEIDGATVDTTEYWTFEAGGGGIYCFETAVDFPSLISKVEQKLGVHGYIP